MISAKQRRFMLIMQVLFFVDYDSLKPIKEKFAIYADKFDPFALESNAMSQYLGMSQEFFLAASKY